MKTITIILSAFFMFSAEFAVYGAESSTAVNEKQKENQEGKIMEMAMRANEIAFSFYKQKAAGKEENFFFSPYSMRSAFAMAREGAKGKTAEEMDKVFFFPSENAEMRLEMQSMAEAAAQAAEGSEFSDANSFWAHNNYTFLPEYDSALKKHYNAAAENADFVMDAEGARKKINSWASDKTNGIIKELLAKGSVDPLTRLVLVNAVYFKGTWQKAFDKKNTSKENFTLNSGKKVKTMFMQHRKAVRLQYAGTEEGQFLAMPYRKGEDLSGGWLEMMIILPKDKEAFADIENNISSEYINEMRRKMTRTEVELYLPRFKFAVSHELDSSLKSMGMPLAFSDNADFSGMTGNNDLKIGYAIQKAFIDVSEEGTEAAAATAVVMAFRSAAVRQRPEVFRADKPFIFLIRDAKTGLIFFMGKLEKPTA